MNIKFFPWIDRLFLNTDRGHIRRTKNIQLIPDYHNRRGGKLSYAEWAHVIGIFQTLIYQNLSLKSGNKILDIGCGTGLLGIASKPFLTAGGLYTGIDVMQDDINYCREHFDKEFYKFIHLDVANPTYASTQSAQLKHWPVEGSSQNMVTALSVWTHLNERDAIFYFKEISRVLKVGGKAMITFFYLDDDYETSLNKREDGAGRFHATNQKDWVFDVRAYSSENWFTTKFAAYPEDVIGITKGGLDKLTMSSGLKLVEYYPGNWKEIPGVYFQDVFIFENIAG